MRAGLAQGSHCAAGSVRCSPSCCGASQVLWLKSQNSEVWLERRTNYTRSLAVMSIVGYVLGLGDRHPSNLMLDRATGKICHIDFGDCFEVRATRCVAARARLINAGPCGARWRKHGTSTLKRSPSG